MIFDRVLNGGQRKEFKLKLLQAVHRDSLLDENLAIGKHTTNKTRDPQKELTTISTQPPSTDQNRTDPRITKKLRETYDVQ